MNNDITNTLSNILSDEKSTELIKEILSGLKDKNQSDVADELTKASEKAQDTNVTESETSVNFMSKENPKVLEIQRKIDILTALLPLFGQDNKEKISKIIKALNIIKTILSITSPQI